MPDNAPDPGAAAEPATALNGPHPPVAAGPPAHATKAEPPIDPGAGGPAEPTTEPHAARAETPIDPGADERAEPTTEPVAPRWTGSAAVPAGTGRKRRRWLRGRSDPTAPPAVIPLPRPPAPPPTPISPLAAGPPEPVWRDPTLPTLPSEPETIPSGAPVDPWADADPLLGAEYLVTRAPLAPPPPQPPPPPAPVAQPGHAGLPATRSWSQDGPGTAAPSPRRAPPAEPHAAPSPPAGPYAPPPPPAGPYAAAPSAGPHAARPSGLPATRVWSRPAPAAPGPPARPAPQGRPAPVPAPARQPVPAQRPGSAQRPAQPPAGYRVAPSRRRRRFPVKSLLFTLATVGCCCGLPGYVAKPMLAQYPAAAALPDRVADLRLRDSDGATARRLERDMRAAHLLADDTFAGVYADGNGKRVTVFGAIGFQLSPDEELAAEVTRLSGEYKIKNPEDVETGTRGVYERCGTGRFDGATVAVCTWADHGSMGTALFTRRSVPESAELLQRFRTAIITTD